MSNYKLSDATNKTNFKIEEIEEQENEALTSKDPSTCIATR